MAKTTNTVPMVEAAQRLGYTWHRTWSAVLRGELIGKKEDNRWVVDADSLARLEASNQAKAA